MSAEQESSKPTESLAHRAYRRLEPELESWLVDMGNFLLIFAGLLVAFGFFRLLRALGISSSFIDWMETLDHAAVAFCFVSFLWTVTRRAALTALEKKQAR
jgi:hypothetical protein